MDSGDDVTARNTTTNFQGQSKKTATNNEGGNSNAPRTPAKESIPVPYYEIPFFSPLSDYRTGAEMIMIPTGSEASNGDTDTQFLCNKLTTEEKEHALHIQSQLLNCGNRMLMFSTRFAAENILSPDHASSNDSRTPTRITERGVAADVGTGVDGDKIGFADKLSAMIESVRLLNDLYDQSNSQ
jgi:hypothetical protein